MVHGRLKREREDGDAHRAASRVKCESDEERAVDDGLVVEIEVPPKVAGAKAETEAEVAAPKSEDEDAKFLDESSESLSEAPESDGSAYEEEAKSDMSSDDAPFEPEEEKFIVVSSDEEAEESAEGEPSSDDDEPLAVKARREKRREAQRARSARRAAKPKLTPFQRNEARMLNNHPELHGVWEELQANPPEGPPPRAEQPPGLSIKLLPFQLEGLHWLQKQESSEWHGGLLADEMGMGKTLQMISLFVSDRKRPTLVVAQTVAILQWRNEIEKFTQNMKVVVWHGAQRSSDVRRLAESDVVLTSYSVMENAYRRSVAGFQRHGRRERERSALHEVQWRRVVLDEAHHIKERSTNTAKGAYALRTDYRWCLSGTPLQNRVGELYSMIRFLSGDPFAYYYCRQCPCKSLHWAFRSRAGCDHCGHKPMQHTCYWNFYILNPIQREGTMHGEGERAFSRLRALLNRIMLRRTKLERADDMGLPPRTIEVRRDYFNAEEEELHDSLYSSTTRQFSTYLDQGTVLNNYSNVFMLITRMRQMANHPDLVLRSRTSAKNRLLGDQVEEVNVCKLCTEEAYDAVMSRCRHVFCRACIQQYIESVEGEMDVHPALEITPDCPYCHTTLSIDLEQPALEPPQDVPTPGDPKRQGILSRIDLNNWRSSTKIEALVEELTKLRELPDKSIKSIVFSQFVNFLDLIAFRLQRAGFNICRLEGNMSPEARNRTIKHFMDNPGVTVFLVSLKAGGVALNLTEASRVYLMDPWWNPAVEVQAMDRIHRLGQHRPILVKRMIIENSIEKRIIEIQNNKAQMVEAAIGKDENAMGRLSVDDLRFLFTI